MWANDKMNGRSWLTADRATMTVFHDCARVNLYWNDGAECYIIEDTREDAIAALRRYGSCVT